MHCTWVTDAVNSGDIPGRMSKKLNSSAHPPTPIRFFYSRVSICLPGTFPPSCNLVYAIECLIFSQNYVCCTLFGISIWLLISSPNWRTWALFLSLKICNLFVFSAFLFQVPRSDCRCYSCTAALKHQCSHLLIVNCYVLQLHILIFITVEKRVSVDTIFISISYIKCLVPLILFFILILFVFRSDPSRTWLL